MHTILASTGFTAPLLHDATAAHQCVVVPRGALRPVDVEVLGQEARRHHPQRLRRVIRDRYLSQHFRPMIGRVAEAAA